MNKLSFNALLISLCLLFGVQYKAASQSYTDEETFAFVREERNNPMIAAPMPKAKMDFSELSPAHSHDFQFVAEKKMLVLSQKLPEFTSKSVVYIQDATGRNIRSISINPNEAVETTIPLSDLLIGSYYYVLIPDTGQNILGTFEIEE